MFNFKKYKSLLQKSYVLGIITISGLLVSVYFNHNSPVISDTHNIVKSDVSNSLSANKIIVWFCAGAAGYAAIYVIGKNIEEK